MKAKAGRLKIRIPPTHTQLLKPLPFTRQKSSVTAQQRPSAPESIHVLIPGDCEYVSAIIKKTAEVITFKILRSGDHPGGFIIITRVFREQRTESREQREDVLYFWICRWRESPEPRNVGSLQKLDTKETDSYPRSSRRNAALWTYCKLLTSRSAR